jgi:hypothetical protein
MSRIPLTKAQFQERCVKDPDLPGRLRDITLAMLAGEMSTKDMYEVQGVSHGNSVRQATIFTQYESKRALHTQHMRTARDRVLYDVEKMRARRDARARKTKVT